MAVIQALGVITDASGAVSAGANVMTWLALAAEWQRAWARPDHIEALNAVIKYHAAGSGIAYLWEQQLLNTPAPGTGG